MQALPIPSRGHLSEGSESITVLENKPIVEEDLAERHFVLSRILRIVDKLTEDDEIFRGVDKTRMMESLSDLIKESPQELMSTTYDELTARIEKVMLIEAMSGMLNDLSPAQMESFEAAVKRRELFQ